MSTPESYLDTLYVLDDGGRIVSTREPNPSRGPLFELVRSASRSACAVRGDVPDHVANALVEFANDEPPVHDVRKAPLHEAEYRKLVDDHLSSQQPVARSIHHSGPALVFPDTLSCPADVVMVEDERLLARHFRGWVSGEIAAGRAPMFAIMEGGYPVSVCFSARRSQTAAEAGVETAMAFRGRGLAARVTTAWALAVRSTGRIPSYSTFWTNEASLSLARKLRLETYASFWGLSEASG